MAAQPSNSKGEPPLGNGRRHGNIVKSLLMVLFAVVLPAQQFDVASFKHVTPNDTRPGQALDLRSGYLVTVGAPLLYLIKTAYLVRDDQLDSPAWISNERYDLTARCPPQTPIAEKRLMLQHLLEERLRITVVHDIVQQNGYFLVVDKGGSKLEKNTSPEAKSMPAGNVMKADGVHELTNAPMNYVAYYLSLQTGQPVVDNTGLDGSYNFQLTWTSGPIQVRAAGGHDAVATMEGDGPTIFDAVRKVGLKLVASKVPAHYLRITHIEKEPVEQ
jgi:uncharacterized protein (TIGR03435 family)